jgi:PucR C-terminal helix-turn-helix domain
MQRARTLEQRPHSADDRGAAAAAPRSTPLQLVSAAVAGESLFGLALTAAEALDQPVAIVIPALGEPAAAPQGAIADEHLRAAVRYACALVSGESAHAPAALSDAVPVQIGPEIVGIVAAAVAAAPPDPVALRAWLDATAAAAAVTALMRPAAEDSLEGSRRALLHALRAGPPADIEAFVSHAQRLGFDLRAGAVAICARRESEEPLAEASAFTPGLIADLGERGLFGLVALAPGRGDGCGPAHELASKLAEAGMDVALSTPRADPASLHDALREAELLLELGPPANGQDQVYRLLVGVLFRDPDELEQLRALTIAPLTAYDAEHDTELLATLREFLLHHGSTTETAEAMQLHRHTVGYRLTRVHEVSALSPYESEGRERLGLGLKADQILAANQRLAESKPG